MRATLLLGVLLASAALAAPKPKIVVDAPGPIKALLTKALKKKFTPVPARSALGDEPDADALKQAARAAGAIGVVTARLDNGSWAVVAHNGADGAALGLMKFKAPKGKKPLKALPKGTDKRLESALARARAPAKEETKKVEPAKKVEPEKEEPKQAEPPKPLTEAPPPPTPVEEQPRAAAPPAEAVEEPSVDGAPAPVALNLGVGLKLFGRRYFYEDDLFKALSKYRLPVGPALQLEADWYPGAHFTRGIGAHVGLSLGFNYALGISSVATDGTRYGTSAMRFRAGLIGRIPLGRLEVLPHLGWATQSYTIASGATGAAKPNIPNVSYSLLRAGLGTRVKILWPVSITAGFAYQAPLSTGEIGSATYFPRLKAGGLDTNFGVAIGPLFDRVELRLGVEYIRYWYAFNPEPGDSLIAGGALDDSFGGSLMLAFVL